MTALTTEQTAQLQEIARRLRVESLRLIARRGAGHPGGALSAAEILAVLYFRFLRIDPANPAQEARDRFILSKGTPRPRSTPPWRYAASSPWPSSSAGARWTARTRHTRIG
jgi:hypothetical protein